MKSEEIFLKNNKRIILRPFEFKDVHGIWENFNEVIDEGIYLPTFSKVVNTSEESLWYSEKKTNQEICAVAIDPDINSDNKIVAQCVIENSEWEASAHVGVLGIIVKKGYRNLGIGQYIMKYSMKWALEIGKIKIILSVFNTNENAIYVYKKLGFSVCGKRVKQFLMHGVYIDEILMEKWLADPETLITNGHDTKMNYGLF